MTKTEQFNTKVKEATNEYRRDVADSLRLLGKYRNLEIDKYEESRTEYRKASQLFRQGKEYSQAARDAAEKSEALEREASRYYLIKCTAARRVGLLQQRLALKLYAAFAECFKCNNMTTASKRARVVIELLRAESIQLRYWDCIEISGTDLTFSVLAGHSYSGGYGRTIEADVIAQQLKMNVEELDALSKRSESELLDEIDVYLHAEKMLMEWRKKYIKGVGQLAKEAQELGVYNQLANKLKIDEHEFWRIMQSK